MKELGKRTIERLFLSYWERELVQYAKGRLYQMPIDIHT